MYMDLDGFQVVGDTYGHGTGDLMLTQVAEVLGAICRKAGVFLARLGPQLPGCVVNAQEAVRLPGIFSLRLPPDLRAAEVLAVMPGLEVSLGSACSSAELAPSYVLEAMGLSFDEAGRSLRLSPGRFTSTAEAERAADSLAQAALQVRATPPRARPIA